MATTGTVKWFDPGEGHGLVERQDGGPDVHVHIDDLEPGGPCMLIAGDELSFDVTSGPSGPRATRVRVTWEAPGEAG